MKRGVDVERLVEWAFRECLVDRAVALVRCGPAGLPTRAGFLGLRVDGGGVPAAVVNESISHDALRVLDAVQRLPADQRGAVIYHARAGRRPDWAARPRITIAPVMEWRANEWRPAVSDSAPPFCPLVIEGDTPGVVRVKRLEYARWRTGLAAVAEWLAVPGALDGFTVTGPAAAREPWA